MVQTGEQSVGLISYSLIRVRKHLTDFSSQESFEGFSLSILPPYSSPLPSSVSICPLLLFPPSNLYIVTSLSFCLCPWQTTRHQAGELLEPTDVALFWDCLAVTCWTPILLFQRPRNTVRGRSHCSCLPPTLMDEPKGKTVLGDKGNWTLKEADERHNHDQ